MAWCRQVDDVFSLDDLGFGSDTNTILTDGVRSLY